VKVEWLRRKCHTVSSRFISLSPAVPSEVSPARVRRNDASADVRTAGGRVGQVKDGARGELLRKDYALPEAASKLI
jgi:hypothetical protein